MISESQHYIRNLIKFKKYTPKGLLYLEEWGSLRLAANTAYLALVTAKLDPDSSDDLLQFAKERFLISILVALPVFFIDPEVPGNNSKYQPLKGPIVLHVWIFRPQFHSWLWSKFTKETTS